MGRVHGDLLVSGFVLGMKFSELVTIIGLIAFGAMVMRFIITGSI